MLGYLRRERILCLLLFATVPINAVLELPNAVLSLLFISVFFYYYILDWRFRKIAKSLPCILWLALNIYHYSNGLIKHVPEINYIDFLHGFKTYASMCICCFWGCLSFKKAIRDLALSFFVKILFIIIFLGATIGMTERLSGVGYSATGVGQCASQCGILFAYLYAIRSINKKQAALLYVIPTIIVMLSQSRNALATLLMSFVLFYIIDLAGKRYHFNIKDLIIVLVIGSSVFISMDFFEETAFAQRIERVQETFEEGRMLQNYSTGTIFDVIVGDRLVYYVRGWEFFMKNPLTGIGIRNYLYMSEGIYPLHSEYMIHICEGGLVAVFIWILYHYQVIRLWFKCSQVKAVKLVAIGSLVIILFCGIYAREFYGEHFYCFYGLIMSLYYRKKWFGKNYL